MLEQVGRLWASTRDPPTEARQSRHDAGTGEARQDAQSSHSTIEYRLGRNRATARIEAKARDRNWRMVNEALATPDAHAHRQLHLKRYMLSGGARAGA